MTTSDVEQLQHNGSPVNVLLVTAHLLWADLLQDSLKKLEQEVAVKPINFCESFYLRLLLAAS